LEYYSKEWDDRAEPTNVYWLTDSENLVKFLTKGSGKPQIQQDIFKVMLFCQRLSIRIIPIHLRRDDPRIQVADEGSKNPDTDDWQVDFPTFQKINAFCISQSTYLNHTRMQNVKGFIQTSGAKTHWELMLSVMTGLGKLPGFAHPLGASQELSKRSKNLPSAGFCFFQNGKQLIFGHKLWTKTKNPNIRSPKLTFTDHS
jgi:hypothetical protein